jgi:polyphosphate glucokinase
MQALGSYKRGRMLFLGLGTSLGSAMIVDGVLEPMELGHLPYKKTIYEDYVGIGGLKKRGKRKWRKDVADVVGRLIAALEPDDVVLGGGNVNNLKVLPPGCRVGSNANAFRGGFSLWKKAGMRPISPRLTGRPNERHGTQGGARKTTKGSPAGRGRVLPHREAASAGAI